eukprot:4520704-Alexandrium_andersonii.AAC.1
MRSRGTKWQRGGSSSAVRAMSCTFAVWHCGADWVLKTSGSVRVARSREHSSRLGRLTSSSGV